MVSDLVQKISIPSCGKHLEEVRRFVEKAANECGLDDSQIYDIKVAVGEACANSIEHGSPSGEQNHVNISAYCNDKGLTVEISDEGQFKRRAIEYDSDGLHHRGRGMAFMLALMDEVDVKTGPRGTTVKMFKKRISD
jgi:anti-sigma regulatory factor (Ser/Thr protein kinase)